MGAHVSSLRLYILAMVRKNDGTSVHTALSALQYLRTMARVMEDWLACSPDLKTLENLWAILKHGVEEFHPAPRGDLVGVRFDGWDSLDMELINNLINSMTQRMQLVIQKAGDRIPD
jgi:hypothetical protein